MLPHSTLRKFFLFVQGTAQRRHLSLLSSSVRDRSNLTVGSTGFLRSSDRLEFAPALLRAPPAQRRTFSSANTVPVNASKKAIEMASSINGTSANGLPSSSRTATTLASSSPDSSSPLHASLPASILPKDFIRIPASNETNTPAYTLFNLPLEKSPHDPRSYRLVRRANGRESLLVHDPKADKAAASMNVNVGHLSDPEGLQGLAHFCEHLLFMGTEKYPRENEYSDYLAKNSGHSNAFTGMDDTNYFFDVYPSALAGALDRFAQFFICPLFDASCTEREIRAVDSEHKKNLQSDMWRLYQLDKATSSKDHAYWRFGTGNLETLWEEPKRKGVDVREELLEFHKRHYSANVMKLSVLGSEPLDVLTRLVVEHFTAVPNKDLQPHIFSGTPYGEEQMSRAIYAKTVKDTQLLEVGWPLPDQGPLWATKPAHFVSHFIGHEGDGSLLSLLKKKGWANGLRAGAGGGTTGFDFFKVSVDLTQDGLKRHHEVALALFSYLRLLRSTPPQEWAFREVSQLNELSFRFKEQGQPMNYVMSLAGSMQKPYPREKLLSAPWLSGTFDPELIKTTMEALKPDKARVVVGSQKPANEGLEWDLKERWYGTEYAKVPLDESWRRPSEEVLDRVAKGEPPIAEGEKVELRLPGPNSFIPQDLSVERKQVDKPAVRPNCVSDGEVSRVWHKKDDRWWLPKAAVFMSLRNPLINSSPSACVKTRLFAELVKDALSEYAYDAELAGLGFSLDTSADAMTLSFDGYNDKLYVLAKVVMERMRDLQVDPKRFELVREMLARAYRNFKLEAPYSLAGFWMTDVTQEQFWTPEQKEVELMKLTPKDVVEAIPQILGRLHIETLVHGNLYKDDALKMAELAETTFKPKPLTPEERRSPRAMLIPRSSNTAIQIDVPNPSNVNSAIEHLCYVGDINDQALRVRLFLYAQILEEPCFNTLRTKEQLGYIVGSATRRTIGMGSLRIIVQSERDAAFVEQRIEAFLRETLTELLEKMSEEDFEREKTSLINKKLEERKNAWEEATAFWLSIQSGYYDFTQKAKDAEAIRSLTKQDIIDFHKQYLDPSSPTRAKVSLMMRSQHIPVPPEALVSLSAELEKRGITPDPEAFGKFMETKPDLPSLHKFSDAWLTEKKASEQDKTELLALIDAVQTRTPVGKGVKLVEDLDAFKATLTPGPYAEPIEDYKDFSSKL